MAEARAAGRGQARYRTAVGAEVETARDMAAAVAARAVSPVELVRRALDRLDRWQPVTNAFSQVFAEEALAEARQAEDAVTPGAVLGPLHGVPVAVKDLFDVAGHETTGCCAAFAGNVAKGDAEAVRRLRAVGAIVIGKTNQHELAAGATNLISACGPTANPWDPSRITGGSSGGSGAAVATGVVPIALGSDTGGSVRMPASFCGCWGLKPTHGPTEGMMPLAPSLDCPGPLARTAADLGLAWRVLSGTAPGRPGEGPPRRVRRAGVVGGWFADRVHPEVRGAVEAMGETLRALGVEVIAVDGEGIEDVLDVWRAVAWSELADSYPGLLERRDLLSARVASFLEFGAARSPEDREAARRRMAEIRAWFDARLREADLLVTPTTPYPPPRADQDEVEVAPGQAVNVHTGGPAMFTEPVNLAGLPALAVPTGRSGEGLPLSVQLIAGRNLADVLVEMALALEAADDRFRPGIAPFPGEG